MKETIIEAFSNAIMSADEAVVNEVKELCIKLGFIKEETVVATDAAIVTEENAPSVDATPSAS